MALEAVQKFFDELTKKRNIPKAQAEVFNKKLDKIKDKYK
jgi:hypothetical protein